IFAGNGSEPGGNGGPHRGKTTAKTRKMGCFFIAVWRTGWDSHPGGSVTPLPAFEAGSFNYSYASPWTGGNCADSAGALASRPWHRPPNPQPYTADRPPVATADFPPGASPPTWGHHAASGFDAVGQQAAWGRMGFGRGPGGLPLVEGHPLGLEK